MAERIVIYWRDIPAQIIVRRRRETAKRELPQRFIEAIDRCAMAVGAKDSAAYLAEWRRAAPEACGDDLEAEADAARRQIEHDYTDDRLKALVASGGFDR